MDLARYLNEIEKVSETVNADDITPKQNEQIYRGNLYCEYNNCSAKLVYNERQKGKFLRYFSTLKGSEHIKGCPNEVVHSGTKAPNIRVEGEDVNISDAHINDVLNDAYNMFYERLHPAEKTKDKTKKKRKKKEPIPMQDNEEAATISVIGTAVTTGEGKTVVEGKEPYIYKREVAEIQEKDKGTTREIHGIIDEMRFYDDEVFINLVGLDGSKISIYMGTPFKTNCEQEFNLLHYINEYIKIQKGKGEIVIGTSIGEITHRRGNSVVQVFDYKHFKVDKLGIYQIVNFINKLV